MAGVVGIKRNLTTNPINIIQPIHVDVDGKSFIERTANKNNTPIKILSPMYGILRSFPGFDIEASEVELINK